MPNIIKQGTDCWITAANITAVATGLPIDVTNYTCYAAARARYHRQVLGRAYYQYRMISPVVAEWSTTPTGTQGEIIMGGTPTNQVQIHVTPTQTEGWRCPLVIVQAVLIDPITGYESRIVNSVFELDFSAIPDPFM